MKTMKTNRTSDQETETTYRDLFIGMPRLRNSKVARESDVLAYICEKAEVGLEEAIGIFVQIRKKERKILKYDAVENEWMGYNTYKETCDLTTTNRALLFEFRKQTKVFEGILEILSRQFGPPIGSICESDMAPKKGDDDQDDEAEEKTQEANESETESPQPEPGKNLNWFQQYQRELAEKDKAEV